MERRYAPVPRNGAERFAVLQTGESNGTGTWAAFELSKVRRTFSNLGHYVENQRVGSDGSQVANSVQWLTKSAGLIV